jgi:hypothetical protein
MPAKGGAVMHKAQSENRNDCKESKKQMQHAERILSSRQCGYMIGSSKRRKFPSSSPADLRQVREYGWP